MCHRNRILFVFALSAGLVPSLLSAQQLCQPASMLPWRASQPELKLALHGPIKSGLRGNGRSDSPAWLLDTAQPIAQESRVQKDLPSVEKESFANLGQLNRNFGTPNTRSAYRKRSSNSAGKRSFRLFRALGL